MGVLSIVFVVLLLVTGILWAAVRILDEHAAFEQRRASVGAHVTPTTVTKNNYRLRLAKAVHFRNVLDIERIYQDWTWDERDNPAALLAAEATYLEAIDAITSNDTIEIDELYL